LFLHPIQRVGVVSKHGQTWERLAPLPTQSSIDDSKQKRIFVVPNDGGVEGIRLVQEGEDVALNEEGAYEVPGVLRAGAVSVDFDTEDL
jgi:hypothetical protein